MKDDSAVSETRPNSSQPVGHYDPLDLDTEDLFVKYKVLNRCSALFVVVLFIYCLILLPF